MNGKMIPSKIDLHSHAHVLMHALTFALTSFLHDYIIFARASYPFRSKVLKISITFHQKSNSNKFILCRFFTDY
jgi:hypothetical protein